MTTETRETLDARIAALARGGELDAATDAVIRAYGPEIYGFLLAILHDEAQADEVFALWSEDVWRGLGGFGWQCTLRTWLYVLSRHAGARHRRLLQRAPRLDGDSVIERVAAEVRSATRSYLRTASRDRFAELRRSLPEEDQVLLVLRVNRGLEWLEIAQTTLDEADPAPSVVRREAARLRKRFERLRAELVTRGRASGLIPQE